MDTAVIILAAGKGTRMNSNRPKVLHEVGNFPLIFSLILKQHKVLTLKKY